MSPQSALPTTIKGRVVSLDGAPIGKATVITEQGAGSSNDDGWYEVPASPRPQWITVEHPNYLSRTRAGQPGDPLLFRLTPDDGETIALHFVGDTMFGRRFYDPNEDGDPGDGHLPLNAGAEEHLALLHPVRPLLANADLTIVNLETALSDDPYVDPTAPRPARFHPSKEYIFASDSSAALALKQAGVDMIDVANNHLYDLLDGGVSDTLASLTNAGFQPGEGFFGAGLSERQAWQPAVVRLNGQTLAVLGCTSITYPFIEGAPDKTMISYIASDAENKGGAARCEEERIRREVAKASATYETVIFMVHGGSEYERAATDFVVRMTSAAREAGATLVINHQPHVVGGFDWDGSSFVAWTLGNFLFDQTVWPTFESYLLAVHVRRGEVIRAYAEPLLLENYLPKGVVAGLADYIARGAAGRNQGPFIVEDGAMETDFRSLAQRYETQMTIEGGAFDKIITLLPGQWASDFSGEGQARPGRDLLRVGGFEDEDVDSDRLEGALWDLDGSNKQIGEAYAYGGKAGIRLERGSRNQSDVVLTPLHRILVEEGSELSLTGMVRASEGAPVSIQLSWYPDTRGPSQQQLVEPLTIAEGDAWQPFRLDARVPAGIEAVGVYLRLAPPLTAVATADFDDLYLIEWAPPRAPFSPRYGHILVMGEGELTLAQDILPGAEAWRRP